MIDDALEVPADARVECDLCIIGAGAAGLTIAREFEGRGLRVLVLESGGLGREEEATDLNRGRNVGRTYFPLDMPRRRWLGGSTNCWAGFCLPLQPIDFEARDWVPHSGWPFDRAHLDPFYARAHEVLELVPADHDVERASGPKPLPLAGPLVNDYLRLSPPLRMGYRWRARIAAAGDVRILLHASVMRLVPSSDRRRIDHVVVGSPGRPSSFTVAARRFVLACGGLENPRILLHSGIGNRLVGRFFMEHPHTLFEGLLLANSPMADHPFYDRHETDGHGRQGLFVAPDALLRAERILTFYHRLLPYKVGRTGARGQPHPLVDAVSRAAAETDGRSAAQTTLYCLGTASEQAPNPDSRVRLGKEVDALGMPRIELDWRLTELDKRSVYRAHELMAATQARAGFGRMKMTLTADPDQWPKQLRGGAHHMGTTRMHTDAREGVCDARGYVHGVDNLVVAGSSLFPTGGAANPTLTIVALALRAADHLRDVLTPG